MFHRFPFRFGPASRARVALAAGVTGLALTVSACSGGHDSVGTDDGSQFRFVEANRDGQIIPVSKRREAPDFSGSSLSGSGSLSLKQYRGKVVLVNFWGSWCPPCRAEAPDLQSLYTRDKTSGLQVVGINVKDQAALARAFVRNKDLTYPNILDPASRIALQFRNFPPNSIPSTILIDRKGRVAGVYLGGKTASEFSSVIKPLLAET